MTTVSNNLIRSGIRFLKDLQNDLGTEKGLEVWDKLRESMGDEVAGQVLFGILRGTHSDIRLTKIGPQKIDAIKLVRECTGMGLKEAKDLVDATPATLIEKGSKEAVDKAKAALEAAGAKVSIK